MSSCLNTLGNLTTATSSWLSLLGPVLFRNHNRSSKYNPLVEEVANLGYAHVRFSDGNVKTVSIRNLAPAFESGEVNVSTEDSLHKLDSGPIDGQISNTPVEVTATNPPQKTLTPHCDNPRPQRSHRMLMYLQDYELF